jgi:ethanolamine ammonia-lyase small subunit
VTRKPPPARDPWASLRGLTPARIALGRSGGSLPTAPLLDFQLAHARAHDAVHLAFDADGIERALRERGFETLRVRSRAADRADYLRRPDRGRRLDADSAAMLKRGRAGTETPGFDAALVVADGLSALAVHRHALALAEKVHAALAGLGWRLAPLVVAEQARVALGDEIGELAGAAQVAMLIGERPGLSAADSLGVYLTYAPQVGRTDAERNCISNIRPEGLSYADATHTLVYLMTEARRRKLTGVALKDDSDVARVAAEVDPGGASSVA